MKIKIVRHGDPDYENDTLTERGRLEAELLSNELSKVDAKAYFVSPLGRAKDTAAYTMKKLGKEAVECDWLREFPAKIIRPDKGELTSITWDWLPQDWTKDERFFSKDHWMENSVIADSDVREKYDYVIKSFDSFLAKFGYERQDNYYKAVSPNNDTIVLFCHFGLECVLLGRLLNISPMVLWHGTCAAPTSVTTIVTEERRSGIAYFRMTEFGDVSHLYMNGENPSFSARFCECYGNPGQRID